MSLINIISFILQHPLGKRSKLLGISRFLRWQFSQFLFPYPVIVNFCKNGKMVVEKGMTGATGNLYVGLHEFEDMAFLLHFLKETDVFFDVGANIGSYSILAAAEKGAITYSFEPSPSTFSKLKRNHLLNNLPNWLIFQSGVGSKRGNLRISEGLDTVNHIVNDGSGTKVPVLSLDDFCKERQIIPQLIKIDVEGYETNVISGANKTLRNNNCMAVIMELNGSGNRYGFDEERLHRYMHSIGFNSFDYNPFVRKLSKKKSRSKNGNTLYIKDAEKVKKALSNSIKYSVNKVSF